MKTMNVTEMKAISGGIHRVRGRFNAYHCSACFLAAFGAGISYLLGYRR